MKNLVKSSLILSMILLGACATRQPLLTTPAVSMTNDSIPAGHKVVDLGPVTATYCYGDPAETKKGDSVGLMDEVTLKAQKEKNATYISNAAFSYEGTSCIVLEGNAMKAE